jgi:hypothetical protein
MATTDELLQREDQAWSAFIDAVRTVPEDRRSDPGVVPGWSVHDMVWHCGYWAGYVANVLDRLGRGEPTEDPQDWDKLDAMVIEDGRAMSWDQIIIESEANRVKARDALQALATVTDEAADEFGGETFDHYDEHAVQVRAFGAS